MFYLKRHLFSNDGKAFSIITPVLNDPSEIILICWFGDTFLIIIHAENSCAAEYLTRNWSFFVNHL